MEAPLVYGGRNSLAGISILQKCSALGIRTWDPTMYESGALSRPPYLAVHLPAIVPAFRYRCGLNGDVVFRPGWNMNLGPSQAALVKNVYGCQTVIEIITVAKRSISPDLRGPFNAEGFGRTLFQSLWQRDFLSMGL